MILETICINENCEKFGVPEEHIVKSREELPKNCEFCNGTLEVPDFYSTSFKLVGKWFAQGY